jgi:hypothetical protein
MIRAAQGRGPLQQKLSRSHTRRAPLKLTLQSAIPLIEQRHFAPPGSDWFSGCSIGGSAT